MPLKTYLGQDKKDEKFLKDFDRKCFRRPKAEGFLKERSETQAVLFDLLPLETSIFYSCGNNDVANSCQDSRVQQNPLRGL